MENYFSKNLKNIRTQMGLSQSELSRKTVAVCNQLNKNRKQNDIFFKPINQASIARWEAGENSPSIDNVFLLSVTLDVPILSLLNPQDKEN